MKNILLLPLIYFFICLTSCTFLNTNETEHKVYFDAIIKTADGKLRIDFKKGIKYIDSAYDAFPDKSKKDCSRKYILISETLYNTYNSYNEALKYIDSAINVLHEDPETFRKDLTGVYTLKGNILVDQNNYDNAFKYFYLAKTIVEKDKNNSVAGWINASLANVLYKQERFKDAIPYYQRALSFYAKAESKEIGGSFIPTQQHMNNIALCYERLNFFDQAVVAYRNTIAYISTNGKKYPKDEWFVKMANGIAYGNLGSTYLKGNQLAAAEDCFKKSLELNVSDEQDAAFTKIKLANLYLKTNRNQAAGAIINQLDNLLKTKAYAQVKFRWLQLAYNYHDKIGEAKKAYNCFKSYYLLKDSMQLINNKNANKDFNREFIKLTQTREIETLKRKDEQKTVYLLFSVGLIALAGLSIFLILRNARISKRNVRQLTKLNAEISSHNLLMEKTLEALEESQEENTHMMQVVAHDMRTPILGIIGLTSLLLDRDDVSDEQREVLDLINVSGGDILNFINDLLQVKYTTKNLIKEPVEMHTLLNYCVTLLDGKAKEKKQELKVTTLPIEINISREKIWRVMSNLIYNAIKFSPHGAKIHVEMIEKPLSVLIKIQDNGIGIPPEMADKLFTINADVQRDGTDGEKSFGLGLVISKQIIEAHNGLLWFESTIGTGTTFFIELPITEN